MLVAVAASEMASRRSPLGPRALIALISLVRLLGPRRVRSVGCGPAEAKLSWTSGLGRGSVGSAAALKAFETTTDQRTKQRPTDARVNPP